MGQILEKLAAGEYDLPPKSDSEEESSEENVVLSDKKGEEEENQAESEPKTKKPKTENPEGNQDNSETESLSIDEVCKEMEDLACLGIQFLFSDELSNWLATNPFWKEHGNRIERLFHSRKFNHEDFRCIIEHLKKSSELQRIAEELKCKCMPVDEEETGGNEITPDCKP